MRITANDIYLDTLCLLIYTSDDISRTLAEDMLKIFEEDMKENPIVGSPETRFWLDIVQSIVESKIDTSRDGEISALFSKWKENPTAKADPSLIETLQDLFEARKTVGITRIQAIKTAINNWVIFYHMEKNLKQATKLLNRFPSVLNPERQRVIVDKAYEYAKAAVAAHEESININTDQIDFVDFTNRESIKRVLELNRRKQSASVLKFGLQSFNRMFNPDLLGAKPGEFGCIISPSHHGKSFTLMNMARWVATYNKPAVRQGLRPAIVFITLENQLDENVNHWFYDAYANLFHKKPESLAEDEVIESVCAEYGKNGFSLLVFRRLANQFGYDEYVTLIKKLQSANYQIIASFIDYISLMKTDEIMGGSTRALQMQTLVRNMKTFSNYEDIFTMTAMQIDREGVRQIRDTYIVKRFTPGNLADCSYAYHEFDVVIFQAIEDVNGQGSYLTMKIDKHRYVRMAPEYKFCAWRFGSLGILDDINGKDLCVKDIYDDSFSVKEETPFDIMTILPSPMDQDGKVETLADVVISTKIDPASEPVMDYFSQLGEPKVLPDPVKRIPEKELNKTIQNAVPALSFS